MLFTEIIMMNSAKTTKRKTGPLKSDSLLSRSALARDDNNRAIALSNETAPLNQATVRGALEAVPIRQKIAEWVNQAESLSQKENFNGADKIYLQIIETCINSPLPDSESQHLIGLSHMNRGWIAQQREKYEQAIAIYTQAIDTFQHNQGVDLESYRSALMTVYWQRGQCYRKLNQAEMAAQDLYTASQFDGDFLKIHENRQEVIEGLLSLITVYIDLTYYQKALNTLAQAREHLKILRENSGGQGYNFPIEDIERLILYRHAQIMHAMEAWDQVEEVYSVLLARISPEKEALSWSRYALLLLAHQHQHGQMDSALLSQIENNLKHFEADQKARQILASPLLALADLHVEAQDNETALKYYSDALRCIESSPQKDKAQPLERLAAYAGRARCLQAMEDHCRAAQAYRKAIELSDEDDGQALLLNQLHFSYLALGKNEEALAALNQSLKIASSAVFADAEHPATRARYFRAFYHVLVSQDIAAAQADLEHVEQDCPGMAAYDLACLAAKAQHAERAFDMLARHLKSAYALKREQIEADSDLSPLQADSRWAQLWQ